MTASARPLPSPEQLYRAASAYVEAGLSVVPAGTHGAFAKQPHYAALKASGHSVWDQEERRVRASWSQLREHHPTDAELKTWFLTYRAGGMALVTGELSGLVALDFDAGAGVELLRQLGFGAHVRSPGGGYHVYTKHPGWHVPTSNAKSNNTLPAGLDIRGDGGLVMLPPSTTGAGAYVRLQASKTLSRQAIPERIQVGEQVFLLRELCGLAAEPVLDPSPHEVTAPDLAAGQRRDSHDLVEYALRIARHRGRNEGGFALARQLRDNYYELWEALELGPYWVSLHPPVNTKGRAEAYTLDHYHASVRSAYRRSVRPAWKG